MKPRLVLPLSLFALPFPSLQAATLWSPAVTEEAPEIRTAAMTEAGFRIEIDAPPATYPVEASPDLADWEPAGEVAATLVSTAYTDAGALAADTNFYRVGGSFEQGLLHAVGFVSRVESSGMPGEQPLGSLWTGHSFETGKVQSVDPADSLLRIDGMAASAFRVQPSNPYAVLGAFIETSREVELSGLTMGETSWTVPGDEDEDPTTLLLLEGEGGALAGIAEDSEQQGSVFYESATAELGLFLAAPASVAANPADLQGDWGIVRILVEAEPGWTLFSGAAYTGSISAAGTELTIDTETEFEAEQTFDPGAVATTESFDPTVDATLAVDLAAGGSIEISEPEGGGSFEGFASPTGKLIVTASTTPGTEVLPEGQEEHFAAHLDEADSQLLVGVKRDPAPALAGKTYRIIRHGWFVGDGSFEIDRSGEGDRLVFSPDGQSVTRTSDFISRSVTFSGELDSTAPGDESHSFPMTVAVAGDGSISLSATLEDGEVTADLRTVGFAQEGGDLLVLVDTASATDGTANLGLILAVREDG